MVNWIVNANSLPFDPGASGLPNVGAALLGLFQPISIQVVVKNTTGFQVVETTETINTRGVVQPLSNYDISLKPEGQRDWEWQNIHCLPDVQLQNDDVILYKGKQYRVMKRGDYAAYGYMNYHVQEDYEGAGPVVTP